MPVHYLNRRETGDGSMLCDAVEFADGADAGERCVADCDLTDVGGDSFTGSRVEFVVKHRLCAQHLAQFRRANGMLIERIG